ncbi:6091_t:CDS:2, partial [Cetraspora pellucida]
SQLEKEAEWNHFFEYQTLSTCISITSIGSEIFPTIDQKISKYLTPHILSAECIEMAQYLYYNAILVNLAAISSNNEVMLVLQIAGFHIRMITSHWYCNDKNKVNDQSNIIFVNEHAAQVQQNKVIQIFFQPLTMPPSSLARQATQLVVDCNDEEIAQWLRVFIDQKKRLSSNSNKDNLSTNRSDDDNNSNSFIVANLLTNKRKGPSSGVLVAVSAVILAVVAAGVLVAIAAVVLVVAAIVLVVAAVFLVVVAVVLVIVVAVMLVVVAVVVVLVN